MLGLTIRVMPCCRDSGDCRVQVDAVILKSSLLILTKRSGETISVLRGYRAAIGDRPSADMLESETQDKWVLRIGDLLGETFKGCCQAVELLERETIPVLPGLLDEATLESCWDSAISLGHICIRNRDERVPMGKTFRVMRSC